MDDSWNVESFKAKRCLLKHVVPQYSLAWSAHVSCLVLLTVTFTSARQTSFAQDEPNDQRLLDVALSATDANYAKLGIAEVFVTEVVEMAGVDAPRTEVAKLNGNVVAQYTVAPREEVALRCVTHGDSIRYEALNPSGESTHTLVFHDGRWTQYDPGGRMAWIRTSEQMSHPGSPLDPRQFVLRDLRDINLSVLLRNNTAFASLRTDSNSREVLSVVIRDTTRGPFELTLDPAKAFLPVASVARYPTGQVFLRAESTYQLVDSASAWFPERIIRRTYKKSALTADDWETRATFTITRIALHDESKLGELFALPIPRGVLVHDGIAHETYRTGSKYHLGFLWIPVLLIVVLGVAIYVRHRRHFLSQTPYS